MIPDETRLDRPAGSTTKIRYMSNRNETEIYARPIQNHRLHRTCPVFASVLKNDWQTKIKASPKSYPTKKKANGTPDILLKQDTA